MTTDNPERVKTKLSEHSRNKIKWVHRGDEFHFTISHDASHFFSIKEYYCIANRTYIMCEQSIQRRRKHGTGYWWDSHFFCMEFKDRSNGILFELYNSGQYGQMCHFLYAMIKYSYG